MHRQYEVNWRCYAQLHNYTLVIERDDDAARWRFERNGDLGDAEVWKGSDEGHVDLRSLPAPYSPFWVKVDLLERFLPGADWAVYFDADALFVALPTRFEEVVSQVASPSTDLFVVGSAQLLDSADIVEHTLCAGLFAVRNSPGGWWFVRRWFALRHQDNLWGDQAGNPPIFAAWATRCAPFAIAHFVRGAVFGERTSEWSRSFKTTTPQTPHAFALRA
ncbi:hypothetical protein KFE25_011736 [Diacronema lutheri]|uniref:Nucleotide-diphospho-sugar transferase domain-containing protein n=1 Tax=Diacronema lutheri TaxID=2081491 RepID=A0A8J5X8F9_DIALT|nr:hypothetical protein KFE25_011736 [Diacronema lutheri]